MVIQGLSYCKDSKAEKCARSLSPRFRRHKNFSNFSTSCYVTICFLLLCIFYSFKMEVSEGHITSRQLALQGTQISNLAKEAALGRTPSEGGGACSPCWVPSAHGNVQHMVHDTRLANGKEVLESYHVPLAFSSPPGPSSSLPVSLNVG